MANNTGEIIVADGHVNVLGISMLPGQHTNDTEAFV